MKQGRIKGFFKENAVWITVISVYIVLSIACALWYVGHPSISFEVGDGPAVETMTVSRGTEITLPRASELLYDGYKLAGWYEDEEFTVPYYGGALEKSMTVYAKWEPLVHTVTFRTSTGMITGNSTVEVEHGKTTDYTPTVRNSSFTFDGWYLDSAFTKPYIPSETVITESISVYAKYLTPTASKEGVNAPVIYITCGESIHRSDYEDCSIVVECDDTEYGWQRLYGQIRGRGNSTWSNYDKKPYRIKFDEKVDLLGMGKARDWVLLASTVDLTFMRNLVVYRMAQQFDSLEYTTDCAFAHVYMNNTYWGLYLVVEQVEEGKNRVEIGDGRDENGKALAPAEMGFLLECGNGDTSGGQKSFSPQSYGSVETGRVVIKSPDPEILTDSHVRYIENYYEQVQRAIAYDDFDKLCELVDIDSFVDSFICTQYVLSGDMGYDYFAYKEPGGKLFLGPLWDYDQAAGSSTHGGRNFKGYSSASPHTWYVKLIKNERFRELVKEAWLEKYDYIHQIPDMLNEIAAYYEADIDLNYERWDDLLGTEQWRTPNELIRLDTYSKQLNYLITWLNNRVNWIETDLGIASTEKTE